MWSRSQIIPHWPHNHWSPSWLILSKLIQTRINILYNCFASSWTTACCAQRYVSAKHRPLHPSSMIHPGERIVCGYADSASSTLNTECVLAFQAATTPRGNKQRRTIGYCLGGFDNGKSGWIVLVHPTSPPSQMETVVWLIVPVQNNPIAISGYPETIYKCPWLFMDYPRRVMDYPRISVDYPWISMHDPWTVWNYPIINGYL